MPDWTNSARILRTVVPYARRNRGRRAVVKLGGSAMEDADACRSTLVDVVTLCALGVRPVIVHGGGKPIDLAMADAGLEPVKVMGRRFTDDATLAVVVRVLKEINAAVVRQLNEAGTRAVGLHSGPLQALFGDKLYLDGKDCETIELGHVGTVSRVDVDLLRTFLEANVVPVIPSLAIGPDGGWLNVNADTAAASVAEALQADRLAFLTDTPGVLRDANDEKTWIPRLTRIECEGLAREGVLTGGMLPKVEACLASLRAGVGRVQILDGRRPFALLAEVFEMTDSGTEIVEA